MATINVRMPDDLKKAGDDVLRQSGVSITQLFTRTYQNMVEQQAVPFSGDDDALERIQQKRKVIESIVGIAPGVTLDEVRSARLSRQLP